MTIDEFIRARLAEDEETARSAASEKGYAEWDVVTDGNAEQVIPQADSRGAHPISRTGLHIAVHDPARELRQVAANRDMFLYILETSGMWELLVGARPPSAEKASADIAEIRAVRAMAAIWSNHPDCREEWKVDP
ncbi:DUF6221 family protein [Nocardia sp. NPDC050630]|uniref:DUF6221 family protein n=1 Tax=Nocardia sp. NPDC050630 TaxID=3364321 RepID=UPI00379839F0